MTVCILTAEIVCACYIKRREIEKSGEQKKEYHVSYEQATFWNLMKAVKYGRFLQSNVVVLEKQYILWRTKTNTIPRRQTQP